MKPTLALSMSLAFGASLFAHPGGLDSKGGHHDRKNGGYHYHRGGPATGGSSGSTSGATQKPEAKPAPKASPSEPQPEKPAEKNAFTKVAIGMTKAEVESAIGKPNVASADNWFFSASGWVRFREGRVFSIEAK